jgi:anti-sigma factor RsiW
MNSHPDKPQEHPDALLLPYIEDTLGPEDLAVLTQHLKECRRCAAEVEALRELTSTLRDNRLALCPEPQQLFEAVAQKGHIDASLFRHLEQCPRCREELAMYAATAPREAMPQEVWTKIKERLDIPAREPHEAEKAGWDFREFFARLFRLPALGVAVAAAVLIVVVLAPWEGAQLPMWEHMPRPKAGTEIGRPRTAVVILFNKVEKPLPSGRIHELYQALEPPIDIVERYDLLAPGAMRAVLGKGDLDARDKKAVLDGLRNKLNVAQAVLITVTPEGKGFQVQSQLVNAANGIVSAGESAEAPGEGDLAQVMKDQVRTLLLKEGPAKR